MLFGDEAHWHLTSDDEHLQNKIKLVVALFYLHVEL
jgi:hypothetical protein